jgi:hypothetical protein
MPDECDKNYTNIKAYFCVDGVCDEEVFGCLGEMPAKIWKKGDNIGRTILKRRSDGWRLSSNLPENMPFASHIENILSRVHPRRNCLTVPGITRIRLIAVMEIYNDDRPPLCVSSSAIAQLAELGAALDVDIYVL